MRNQMAEFRATAYPDSRLIPWINDAQSAMSLRLDFPRGNFAIPTQANINKYQIPELVKYWAVYVQSPDGSQQELFGTDIGTLQGDWRQMYDNTSGTVMGAPTQTPQWLTGQPVPYPYQAQQIGGWVATKTVWQNTPGQRPAFAMDGGWIYVLPTPATSTSTILIDCVPSPPIMGRPQDPSIFPLNFINAIKWKVVADARDSEAPGGPGMVNAMQRYEAELAQNSMWVERLQATNPKIFVPLTVRGRMGSWAWGTGSGPWNW